MSALPLLSTTSDAWAETALREPLELLDDHAHLEKKAAGNALELLHRWPDAGCPRQWVPTLTAVARDETVHLALVCRLLARRGGVLQKNHKNPYATELRRLVRKGKGTLELLDRLLVAALIEARSCERFEVLGRVARDAALAKLYQGLYASEAKHYAQFLRLAELVRPAEEVAQRWRDMLTAEAEILARQPPGPRMHSGI